MTRKADGHILILDPQSVFSISTRLLTVSWGQVSFHLQETLKPSQTAATTFHIVPRFSNYTMMVYMKSNICHSFSCSVNLAGLICVMVNWILETEIKALHVAVMCGHNLCSSVDLESLLDTLIVIFNQHWGFWGFMSPASPACQQYKGM